MRCGLKTRKAACDRRAPLLDVMWCARRTLPRTFYPGQGPLTRGGTESDEGKPMNLDPATGMAILDPSEYRRMERAASRFTQWLDTRCTASWSKPEWPYVTRCALEHGHREGNPEEHVDPKGRKSYARRDEDENWIEVEPNVVCKCISGDLCRHVRKP